MWVFAAWQHLTSTCWRSMRTFGTAIKGMSLTSNETDLYVRGGSGVVNLLWFTGELMYVHVSSTHPACVVTDSLRAQLADFWQHTRPHLRRQ